MDEFSVLTLGFDVPGNNPDWPLVTILVDGKNPFAKVAPDWQGFDPADLFGPPRPAGPASRSTSAPSRTPVRRPLVPVLPGGHRAAVYRCSCGEPGCGVIAPLIVASPDHARISWVDFRDYTGVFDAPLAPAAADYGGTPWPLPDLHFARDQYLREVRRATDDRSWETPRRRTARFLEAHLRPRGPVLPPGLTLNWIVPAWERPGMLLSFEQPPANVPVQQLLLLNSSEPDPAEAAADMAARFFSVSPEDWVREFGY
ncbi:hypothetical protein [Kribbella solani]|uniref:Uncharacterized protein n=1 Tax=Kribbella solani TaxID=236067 RepID=A0A841DXX5_9ACTN|nr:hypothetical protein [Kribbella solani]MBB5981645.1 hypothetical protein [Kribbella solani]